MTYKMTYKKIAFLFKNTTLSRYYCSYAIEILDSVVLQNLQSITKTQDSIQLLFKEKIKRNKFISFLEKIKILKPKYKAKGLEIFFKSVNSNLEGFENKYNFKDDEIEFSNNMICIIWDNIIENKDFSKGES